jgi:hypothetical protein
VKANESGEHEIVSLLGVCALLLIELTTELISQKKDALE